MTHHHHDSHETGAGHTGGGDGHNADHSADHEHNHNHEHEHHPEENAPARGLKRETRAGLAILLSFVILAGVLVGNKLGALRIPGLKGGGTRTAKNSDKPKEPGRNPKKEANPLVAAIPPRGPGSEAAGSRTEPTTGGQPGTQDRTDQSPPPLPEPAQPGPPRVGLAAVEKDSTDPLDPAPEPPPPIATGTQAEGLNTTAASGPPPLLPGGGLPRAAETEGLPTADAAPPPSPVGTEPQGREAGGIALLDAAPAPAPAAAAPAPAPAPAPEPISAEPPRPVNPGAGTGSSAPLLELPTTREPAQSPAEPPASVAPRASVPEPQADPAPANPPAAASPLDQVAPAALRPGSLTPAAPASSGMTAAEFVPDTTGWVTLPSSSGGKPAATRLASAARETAGSTPAVRAPLPAADDTDDPIDPVWHVVKSGENFWTISKAYYNSPRYYMALWSANRERVPAPEQLRVGQSIRVPPPEKLDRSLIQPLSAVAAAPAPARAPEATSRRRGTSPDMEITLPVGSPSASPGRSRKARTEATNDADYPHYQVRPHDTLRSIARDALGDSRRSDEIYDMNRDAIADPHRLTPGQTLILPDDARLGRRSK